MKILDTSPSGRRSANICLLISLTLYLTVSAPLLTVLHIPYDAPTGNFMFKLHPATYFLFAGFAIFLLRDTNPLQNLIQSVVLSPLMGFHLFVTLFLLFYSALRHGMSGSAFIIDTLIAPAICALLLRHQSIQVRRTVLLLIIALVSFNAVIGIFESLTQFRLIPYTTTGGVPINESIFRSTSLLGHPLTNALITGPVMIVFAGFHTRPLIRAFLLIILWIGLLSFGGRTSFIITSLILSLYFLFFVSKSLLRGKYSYLQVTGALVAMMLLLSVLISIISFSNLGERIFATFFWDNSANARLGLWRAFDFINAEELFFGLAPAEIEQITYRLSMEYELAAIENFWLLMLLQLGIVGFIPFIFGLFASIVAFWTNSTLPVRLSILAFFLVASSNNSLASKNPALTLLFATWACTSARIPASRKISRSSVRRPSNFEYPS